jgi:hypothetical protein
VLTGQPLTPGLGSSHVVEVGSAGFGRQHVLYYFTQVQTPLWCVQLLATCQVHQIICQQHCRVHGSAATAAAAVAVLAAIGSRSGRGCNAYALPLASRLRCTL